MPPRDYETAPATTALGIEGVIHGLVQDLEDLRAGRIGTGDAMARSALAKQIFNGFRIYLNGSKMLASSAKALEGN